MMKFALLIFALMTTPLFAQTAPAAPAPKAAPIISDAQKLAFFKASAELQSANAQSQQKSDVLNKVEEAVSKTCGTDYRPSIDNVTGDLVCVAVPSK